MASVIAFMVTRSCCPVPNHHAAPRSRAVAQLPHNAGADRMHDEATRRLEVPPHPSFARIVQARPHGSAEWQRQLVHPKRKFSEVR
eukprot:6780268-Prymnesium_polylepis.2